MAGQSAESVENMNALRQQTALNYPDTWKSSAIDTFERLASMGKVDQFEVNRVESELIWFRLAREEMKALQAAFEEMKFQLESYTGDWIISVYGDASDYVPGTTWHVEDGTPPVMYMSDQLYDLYCRSIGMENANVRTGAKAE